MGSSDNHNGVNYSAELEAIHVRQNLQEEREIKQGIKIKKLEVGAADHRDWIVKALGPVQAELLSLRNQLSTIERALERLFALHATQHPKTVRKAKR